MLIWGSEFLECKRERQSQRENFPVFTLAMTRR
jgi:hypothetical protein